ncbi:MAG TPA: PEP-CTERM sorting domain-containing protein [Bryobacteraceae bacterium]|nr:PEP-CTERM sorting domain-containing protein [Bryobacteraceae bacterium]
MVLKAGSAKKLASLSALGVGTLVVGAKDAKATVIFGTPNAIVGFDNQIGTPGGTFTSPTLGAGAANFQFTKIQSKPGLDSRRKIAFGGHSLSMRAGSSGVHTMRVFNAGATFSTGAPFNHAAAAGFVGSVFGANLTAAPSTGGPSSYNDMFALFKFTNGLNTDFGWIELSWFINGNGITGPSNFGPDLKIMEWAYDDSGAHLAAGSLQSPAPEPSTLAFTGLAALALGAAGARRWRAARKPA